MKHLYKLLFSVFVPVIFALQGCTDPNAIIDQNTEIGNHNWSYINRVKFDVNITDEKVPYNLYFNLRVGGGYRYSNIYVLLSQKHGSKTATTRYQFVLANPDGEWLGSGSGNLYSYQLPFRKGYKFPEKGTYHFEIEQNMRDNPLHEVSDIGLRVEKAQ
ncbi:gliding motility lipoprotein GldH [Mucilaginibacter pedocola]|uniref:Gliding motility lipoprotein GldH n=1 Tax=Mucilaginibacter pedocola TaxID=1792845 RepID=A0A1S9PL91_9SPHI|nr:gliding motility lipoprotein GldH [Mucilaginibacter pedocola]OOQ61318.1 gliding motility lipoprotein GldH [Mucilaginibacter pedocola]